MTEEFETEGGATHAERVDQREKTTPIMGVIL